MCDTEYHSAAGGVIPYTSIDGQATSAQDLGFPDAEVEGLILANAHLGEIARLKALFDQRRADEKKLLMATTAAQAAVGWGDHFRVNWHPPGAASPVVVYGHVIVRSATADWDELTRSAVMRGYQRGWRVTHAFSVLFPDGTFGTHHVAQFNPIERWEFEAAELAGWRPVPLLLHGSTQLPCGCPLVVGCLGGH